MAIASNQWPANRKEMKKMVIELEFHLILFGLDKAAALDYDVRNRDEFPKQRK